MALDQHSVGCMDFTSDNLVNKTILVFGSSNSGKTTLVRDLLYRMRNELDTAFIISGTKNSSGSYESVLPEEFIHKTFDPVWFDKYIKRQAEASETYRLANNLDVLRKIFKEISTPEQKAKMNELRNAKKNAINKYKLMFQNDPLKLEKLVNLTKEIYRAKTLEFYKQVIRKLKSNRSQLEKHRFDENEAITIDFCNFNPRSLILFDDCASEFKRWYSENQEHFKKLFYQGRWYNITTIITSQDDKEINSELRKNSSYIFFTTIQAAICNFTKKSNGYSSYTIKKCETLCKPTNFDNHMKMVFIRDSSDQFKFFKAVPRKDFRLGSDNSVWRLSKLIDEKKKRRNKKTTNMFLRQYKRKTST